MKKILILTLSIVGTAINASTPLQQATLAVLNGALPKDTAAAAFNVSITKINQELNQYQGITAGDYAVIVAAQDAAQSANLNPAQTDALVQAYRSGKDPQKALLSIGVAVTKIKQVLNQMQNVTTGQGNVTNITRY